MPRMQKSGRTHREALSARLGLEHFAFYRAYLEGSSSIDLVALAEVYLNVGRDPRKVQTTLRWLRDELGAAARRINDRQAVRLLRLPKAIGSQLTRQDTSLEDFRDEVDPEGVFGERELLELYHARHGMQLVPRKALQATRLRERRMAALRRLEQAVVEAPSLHHLVQEWLDPVVARRLEAVGIRTLEDLFSAINKAGFRWYAKVPRLGERGAARIVKWLTANAESLSATVSVSARTPIQSQARSDLYAQRAAIGPIAPLEVLQLPATLSGSDGNNRADRVRNQTGAENDLQAITAWLDLFPVDSHTRRSYRTQAERMLLWSVYERGKPLSSLGVADITAYRAFMSNPPEHWVGSRQSPRWSSEWRPFGGPLSASSRATACSVLKALFHWLVEMRYLDFNPWRGVKITAEEKEAQNIRADHALTRKQWEAVLMSTDALATSDAGERARFLVRLGYYTGLRLSEICHATLGGLSTRWVDDTIGNAWTITVTGKRKKQRTVPMPRELVIASQRYLRSRGLDEKLSENDPATPLIGRLDNDAGKTLNPQWLASIFKQIFTAAAQDLQTQDRFAAGKLRSASAHWLRHTYGSRAVEAGVPLSVVQENLGHVSPTTTSIYVTTELDRRVRAMHDFS